MSQKLQIILNHTFYITKRTLITKQLNQKLEFYYWYGNQICTIWLGLICDVYLIFNTTLSSEGRTQYDKRHGGGGSKSER